jgi:AcrR family transcriptional regulator
MPHPRQIAAHDVLRRAIDLLEANRRARLGAKGGTDEEAREELSLRAVARRLGVKAPSLYRYFADKAALERAVAEEGSRLLLESMKEALGSKTGRRAFAAAAGAYMLFAEENPALYAFMMTAESLGASDSPTGKRLWELVLRTIGGISGNPDDTPMAVAFWSFLHGFVSLEQAGRFAPSGPGGGFEAGLEALLAWCERRK